MKRPLIADLFCGAGGAGMGLHRAGFEVVGFDIKPQPRYPFEFHEQDALTVDLSGFDAVWASPPCQYYSRLRHLPWLKDRVYWRSIPSTRAHLTASGKPFIIENVEDARSDMHEAQILCGQALGMSLYRHRAFESSVFFMLPPHQRHQSVITPGRASLGQRHHGDQGFKEINRHSIAGKSGRAGDVARRRQVTGIDWMTGTELAQAVPPAYSEYLGRQFIRTLYA